jgi:transposase-like protein
MATGSKKSVAQTATPAVPEFVQSEVDEILQSSLADFTVRQLLGFLISSAGVAERNLYLQKSPTDRANGFYERAVQIGATPIDIEVPRSRRGEFRPSSLPAPYKRGYPEETHSLLVGLLTSSRSINAAKQGLRQMGLSHSEEELELVAKSFVEELQLRNSRSLDPDLLALFVDGKYIEWREGDKLRPATIYVAVGLGRDGKKRVLACLPQPGRESLEGWKIIFRSLAERGLRRLMVIVQDDFTGLLPYCQSMYPQADVQLCTVHMQRNAKSHLSKADSSEFQERWRAIKETWDIDVANNQFEQLCEHFAHKYPTWISELRKKRPHYLAFLKYPYDIRRVFSSTNLVEAVNGQLEIMRRNCGGFFHSEETLKCKLGIAVSSLENATWSTVPRRLSPVLLQLNAMFESRFEAVD